MYIEAAQYAAIDQALTDAGFGIQFAQDNSSANTVKAEQTTAPEKKEVTAAPSAAKNKRDEAVYETVAAPAEEAPKAVKGPTPKVEVVAPAPEPIAEPIAEAPVEKPTAGGYTNDMSVAEICARMTLEEAENYIVPLGTCNGQTMKRVADRRPASLRYYISGYSGDNNILRAAATLVSEYRSQKAS